MMPVIEKNKKSKEVARTDKRKKGASISIPMDMIDPFPNHPFRVCNDEDMINLANSIREHGCITPCIVRPKTDGRYELISGHRRKFACEMLGFEKLPCEILEISDETAIILMVESNFQRTQILPSEKAFAYRMRMEAMKKQGQRNDLTSRPLGDKSDERRTGELIGDSVGESERTVQRYIRLTNLVPELLDFVDEGKIKMRPAVELSYLDEETQRDVVDQIDETEVFPSFHQAHLIRQQYEANEINYKSVCSIMNDKPEKLEKFKLNYQRLVPLLPLNLSRTDRAVEEYVVKALVYYRKHFNN